MNSRILNKYLAQYRSISIPGLGALVVESIPAITDFVNRQIHPVQHKIRFDKYFDAPDREFFNYLAHQQDIPDFEAIRWYNEFAYDLRTRLRTEGKAAWEGVGEFRKDESGEIIFEQYRAPYELYPSITADRVVRNTVNHSLLVGDKEKTAGEMAELLNEEYVLSQQPLPSPRKWIKTAIWLALAALALLMLHFAINGFRWGSSANRLPVGVISYFGSATSLYSAFHIIK
jgi:hypothetical protein